MKIVIDAGPTAVRAMLSGVRIEAVGAAVDRRGASLLEAELKCAEAQIVAATALELEPTVDPEEDADGRRG